MKQVKVIELQKCRPVSGNMGNTNFISVVDKSNLGLWFSTKTLNLYCLMLIWSECTWNGGGWRFFDRLANTLLCRIERDVHGSCKSTLPTRILLLLYLHYPPMSVQYKQVNGSLVLVAFRVPSVFRYGWLRIPHGFSFKKNVYLLVSREMM